MKVYIIKMWDSCDRYEEIEAVYTSIRKAKKAEKEFNRNAKYGCSYDMYDYEVTK